MAFGKRKAGSQYESKEDEGFVRTTERRKTQTHLPSSNRSVILSVFSETVDDESEDSSERGVHSVVTKRSSGHLLGLIPRSLKSVETERVQRRATERARRIVKRTTMRMNPGVTVASKTPRRARTTIWTKRGESQLEVLDQTKGAPNMFSLPSVLPPATRNTHKTSPIFARGEKHNHHSPKSDADGECWRREPASVRQNANANLEPRYRGHTSSKVHPLHDVSHRELGNEVSYVENRGKESV